jgi:pimeloyl-ACP methyl ester carboxylesterase
MTKAAQTPVEMVAEMRTQPVWLDVEGRAHTLAYEAAVMRPGNALPADRFSAIETPTLILTGGNSPAWMTNAARVLAATLPVATLYVLKGQSHDVSPNALAPALLEFFGAEGEPDR